MDQHIDEELGEAPHGRMVKNLIGDLDEEEVQRSTNSAPGSVAA